VGGSAASSALGVQDASQVHDGSSGDLAIVVFEPFDKSINDPLGFYLIKFGESCAAPIGTHHQHQMVD